MNIFLFFEAIWNQLFIKGAQEILRKLKKVLNINAVKWQRKLAKVLLKHARTELKYVLKKKGGHLSII